MSAYYCYILECADGSFYTGLTTDPQRREREHNRGNGARYTRTRRPVRLVYFEIQPDRLAAMRRERQIKTFSRAQKEKLVASSYITPELHQVEIDKCVELQEKGD